MQYINRYKPVVSFSDMYSYMLSNYLDTEIINKIIQLTKMNN